MKALEREKEQSELVAQEYQSICDRLQNEIEFYRRENIQLMKGLPGVSFFKSPGEASLPFAMKLEPQLTRTMPVVKRDGSSDLLQRIDKLHVNLTKDQTLTMPAELSSSDNNIMNRRAVTPSAHQQQIRNDLAARVRSPSLSANVT